MLFVLVSSGLLHRLHFFLMELLRFAEFLALSCCYSVHGTYLYALFFDYLKSFHGQIFSIRVNPSISLHLVMEVVLIGTCTALKVSR